MPGTIARKPLRDSEAAELGRPLGLTLLGGPAGVQPVEHLVLQLLVLDFLHIASQTGWQLRKLKPVEHLVLQLLILHFLQGSRLQGPLGRTIASWKGAAPQQEHRQRPHGRH